MSLLGCWVAWKWHDKYDPARWFLWMWGGQIVVIGALFFNLFGCTGYSMVYIMTMCLLFSVGTKAGQWLGRGIPEKDNLKGFEVGRSVRILQLCLLLATINALEGLYANDYRFSDLFSWSSLLKLNDAASDARYLKVAPVSLLARVTLVFVYLAPLFGGYLIPLIKGKKRIWAYSTVLPSMVMALTVSVKSMFITSVALWCIGVLVSSAANNRHFIEFRRATIYKLATAGLAFLVILFVSMVFRTGKVDGASIRVTGQKFVVYSCGQLPAFDGWFQEHVGSIKPSYGAKTFYGFTNTLGIAERKQGIFTEYVVLGKKEGPQVPHLMDTNVYTIFRFLMEDFGLMGSLLVMLLTGGLSGMAGIFVKRQPGKVFFQVVLMAVFFTVAWSFVGSVWAYASYMLTMVLMLLLLMVSRNKKCDTHEIIHF